jgi:hypothetical protein
MESLVMGTDDNDKVDGHDLLFGRRKKHGLVFKD